MGGELRDKVASGVAWSLGEKLGTILLQMVVSIVVARLLMPDDVGLMALMTFFSSLALVVVDSGFSQMLIRKGDPAQGDYKSVFLFNVVVSWIVYGVLVAVFPAVAAFYGRPILARIAPVLFLLVPVNALGTIQNTIFMRQFRFALLSKITFVASLASGVLAVTMALAGCGVWSLVGQRLSSIAVRALLLWFFSDWRPRRTERASTRPLREMAPYSLRLMATDLISAIYTRVAQLFIGKIYSTDLLGYFYQAQKLEELPVTSTVQSVQNVTFPAFSKLAASPRKFAESYRQVVMIVAFLMFPAMTGLSAVAPDLFALLLGERWMPTVPYFEAMCLVGLFTPLAMIAYNVLKTLSDGRVVVRLEVVKRVLMTGGAGGDYSAQRHGDRVGHGGHGGHRTGAQSRCDDAALHAVSLAVRADAAAHRGRYGADVRHGGVGRATPYRRPAPRLAAYGAADRRRRGLRRCRGPFPAGIPARDAGDRTEVMAQNLLM